MNAVPILCHRCRREILPTPQPDTGPQRVWANTKDGPAHVECPPPPPMPVSQTTGD
jgi:hypothetical protein